ncbi:MAG: cytochrome c [Bacteroidetes bacterium]|nr:cytochrome c [Bacteroidota bacterium]
MKHYLLGLITLISVQGLAQKQDKQIDDKSLAAGREIYLMNCQSCHMEQGEGLEGVYPPLAKSDYLMADKTRAIQQILKGVSGPITVNGLEYNAEMQGFSFSDQELADLLNYIRNSFGNKGGATTIDEVRKARSKP